MKNAIALPATGAIFGKVELVTPSGTLSSNVAFRVFHRVWVSRREPFRKVFSTASNGIKVAYR